MCFYCRLFGSYFNIDNSKSFHIDEDFSENFPDGGRLQKKEWLESIDDKNRIRVWWKGIGIDFYQKWKEITK